MKHTDQFLTDRTLAERYQVSRSTIWRWLKDTPNFPHPVKLAGSTRWRLSDLEKWEQEALA